MEKMGQTALRVEIKKLLREALAAMCFEEKCAAWRVADAGLLLRQLFELPGRGAGAWAGGAG